MEKNSPCRLAIFILVSIFVLFLPFPTRAKGADGNEVPAARTYQGSVRDLLVTQEEMEGVWTVDIDLLIEDVDNPPSLRGLPESESWVGSLMDATLSQFKRSGVRSAANISYEQTLATGHLTCDVRILAFEDVVQGDKAWKASFPPVFYNGRSFLQALGEENIVSPSGKIVLRRSNIRISLTPVPQGADCATVAYRLDGRIAHLTGMEIPSPPKDTLSQLMQKPNCYRIAEEAYDTPGPAFVDPLTECLAEEDVEVRKKAAQMLGLTGSERAVEPLNMALNDPDPYTRRYAARSLGHLGIPAGIDALASALKDEDDYVRKESVKSLGSIQDERVTPLLIEALKSSDVEVGKAAADALGAREEADAVEPLMEVLNVYLTGGRAAAALAAIGEPAVPQLIEALGRSDREWPSELGVLGRIGTPAVTPLLKLLDMGDAVRRKFAAQALGQIGDKRAVMPLVKLLDDTDRDVVNSAIVSLRYLADPRAVPALIAIFERGVVYPTHEALLDIGEPTVIPLLRTLRNENEKVRAVAVEILGRLKDPRAVEGLVAALSDPADRVRIEAARALDSLDQGLAPGPLIEAMKAEASRTQAMEHALSNRDFNLPLCGALLYHREDTLPLLTSLLDAANPFLRIAAITCMRRIEYLGILERLQTLMNDDHKEVRTYAQNAVTDIQRKIETIENTRSGSTDERIKAILRLVNRAKNGGLTYKGGVDSRGFDDAIIDALVAVAADEDARVRETALGGLGHARHEGTLGILLEALKDPEERVRASAAAAIGMFGDPETAGPLMAAYKSNRIRRGHLRSWWLLALMRTGDPSTLKESTKIWLTVREEREVIGERQIAELLAKVVNEEVFQIIVEHLEDPEHQHPIDLLAGALGEMGDRRGVALLLKDQGDGRIGVNVQKALEKITGRKYATGAQWKRFWRQEDSGE